LYERGDVDDAERLLDECNRLGSEGGPPVEFIITRLVIGARIKALRGDRDAAAKLLDDGAHIAAAETPWFRWRLGLLDFDQGLVGPFRSVEDGFELCGR